MHPGRTEPAVSRAGFSRGSRRSNLQTERKSEACLYSDPESAPIPRKLFPPECRSAVAILSSPQRRQPPASVLHRERIKNRNLRTDKFGCKLPSLFGRNRGIEKNQIESALPHIFRRDGLRRHEGPFTSKFLERTSALWFPRNRSGHQQNIRGGNGGYLRAERLRNPVSNIRGAYYDCG